MTSGSTRGSAGALVLLLALLATSWPDPAKAANDAGHEGHSFAGAGASPSQSKPESKLWWHDGFWWASLFSEQARAFHIHRLDRSAQRWIDTGVLIDERNNSRADVLSVGDTLYVVTHVWAPTPRPGPPARLLRYTYHEGTVEYVLDRGFPVTVNSQVTPSLVFDRDGAGRLWATWVQDDRVHVAHTDGDDGRWSEPFVPAPAAASDAVIATVARVGDGIGLLWADEAAGTYWYAGRAADADPATWGPAEVAMQGPNLADDHGHLRATSDGRVLAVVKTGIATRAPVDLLVLLERTPDGAWRRHPVSSALESNTRAILVIDDDDHDRALVHVVATGPEPPSPDGQRGGRIVVKTAPLDTLSFGPGPGRSIMSDPEAPVLNNATSTKQLLTREMGLVVVATNQSTQRYWHADDPEAAPTELHADFAASPRSGLFEPLVVQFLDRSTGRPTGWTWDFGDGSPAVTEANPRHTYERPGRYTVTLTVTDGGDSSIARRPDYIEVGAPDGEHLDDPESGGIPGPVIAAVGGAAALLAIGLVSAFARRRRADRGSA